MFKIKQANIEDMQFIINLAKDEGWNPGVYDAKTFYDADHDGFFIGLLDNQPIGCISAVKYYPYYGFMGLFIVKKEFRGKGYGSLLWKNALNYLGEVNIGLDGVLDKVEFYKKYGFKEYFDHGCYVFKSDISLTSNKNILPAKDFFFKDLNAYDKNHFGSSREKFLYSWVHQPDSHTFCYFQAHKIIGFGTIRKATEGYKIGPLYAANKSIAEELFLRLISEVKGENIYMNINESSKDAMSFVEQYNMTKSFATKRMYLISRPNIPTGELFGTATLEIG